MNIRERNE
jgi:hypothetical protein